MILAVEFVLDFNLIVVVGRQEGKANNPKQVLQVATANAGEVGCLLRQGPVKRESNFRGPNLKNSIDFFFGTVPQVELHNRAQASSALHREGARVKVYVANEVHIDHAHRTTACALGCKVVDGRNLNPVQKEDVLVGATTSNN